MARVSLTLSTRTPPHLRSSSFHVQVSLQGLACSPFRRAVVGKFRKALCSDVHLVELRAPRLLRGPGSSSYLALVFLVRLVTLWRVAFEVVRVVQMTTPNLVRQVLRLRIGEFSG